MVLWAAWSLLVNFSLLVSLLSSFVILVALFYNPKGLISLFPQTIRVLSLILDYYMFDECGLLKKPPCTWYVDIQCHLCVLHCRLEWGPTNSIAEPLFRISSWQVYIITFQQYSVPAQACQTYLPKWPPDLIALRKKNERAITYHQALNIALSWPIQESRRGHSYLKIYPQTAQEWHAAFKNNTTKYLLNRFFFFFFFGRRQCILRKQRKHERKRNAPELVGSDIFCLSVIGGATDYRAWRKENTVFKRELWNTAAIYRWYPFYRS